MNEILIEAESFAHPGGWVIDTQSMPVMHSAYLMAHGMGIPVEDATTEVQIDRPGRYTVWARTRDWTAVWRVAEPAGKFRIAVDASPLTQILGTNGPDWAWQKAGSIALDRGSHQLALHDLTGFNGRCDAVYLTDGEDAPGEDIDALRQRLNWRELREEEEAFDLIVVGGGVAGICTALAAARSGVRTALIHDREVLGGCNSSEVRVCMGGQIKWAPYEKLGDVVREIAPVMGHPSLYKKEYFEDERKKFAFEASAGNYRLLLGEAVTDIEKEGERISAVICTNIRTGKKTRIRGRLFSDCSGDGVLARLGGAEMMYGREAASEFGESLGGKTHETLVMGHTIRWYSQEQETASVFPDLDWNLPLDEDSYLNCTSGDWEQETGFTRDMVQEAEYIRDYGLRAVYANWSYQKNHCANREKFAKSKLMWVSAFGGKREGYRVKGDYILTQYDLENAVEYPDATAKITWGIDIHFPEPINAEKFGEAFRSFAYHRGTPIACDVPYRCLYAKDIPNLFIGGRLVSTSHVAFSAVRVMRTLGMLGEVVGLAAAVCTEKQCDPRTVYEQYLDELKRRMANGVPIPTAFCCGGIGESEAYHFKDIGWWQFHNGTCADNAHQPRTPEPKEIEKFKKCVTALGMTHKFPMPEKW